MGRMGFTSLVTTLISYTIIFFTAQLRERFRNIINWFKSESLKPEVCTCKGDVFVFFIYSFLLIFILILDCRKKGMLHYALDWRISTLVGCTSEFR